MNKASFLTLVRQASRISDQDVAELEKLVVNFPYCQTAHLLIAKAAYDKGSMLSNQKLKKAAIYAANRQLLKKLIYTSDATVALHPVHQQEATETVAETREKVQEITPVLPEAVSPKPAQNLPEITREETVSQTPERTETEILEKVIIPENTAAETPEIEAAPEAEEQAMETEIAGVFGTNRRDYDPELPVEAPEQIKEHHEAPVLHTFEAPVIQITEVVAEPEVKETEPIPTETQVEAAPLLAVVPEAFVTEDEIIAQEIKALSEENMLPVTLEISTSEVEAELNPEVITNSEDAAIAAEILAEESNSDTTETVAEPVEKAGYFISEEPAATLNDVPDLHELFLENAPDPVAGNTFVPEPEISQPETTSLNDELLHETLASFDQYLFKPEKETEEAPETEDVKVVYPEDIIQHIYDQDSLGYWMGSSRLGESLQMKDELTSPQPFDFHPELIWEYSKTHELEKEIKPVASKLSHQLDIIDQFLKMTPRLKAMANTKIKAEPQEDLSLKSSKINKNLASENFANILVQQGKIKKAIKIYEHLILKIPEKKAYFVAQIEKLQNPD